ncbi:MAG: hypothetical protein DWQ31_16790 [Planctomycetota bacterium]|nr:MAG: hypothetical protein DWQ31_16790 [Planctomycetota bacterium]REJ92011.1 MAG: hypothetical protein DWQ35_12740 [Planctomycetota bacterium]REK28547.1 MAG: hypothetical protein DWQ42_04330 [Planctomycetota bacterium]REK39162.1 MAG: hypothetical protein DWQ46_17915 [Planctomycetota bacterium]
MSRMTRHQFLATKQTRRRTNRDTAATRLLRQMKRQLVAAGKIEDPVNRPPKYEWRWQLGSDFGHEAIHGIVQADTRSEARAFIKRELGIPKNRRLPMQITIEKVPPCEDSRNVA